MKTFIWIKFICLIWIKTKNRAFLSLFWLKKSTYIDWNFLNIFWNRISLSESGVLVNFTVTRIVFLPHVYRINIIWSYRVNRRENRVHHLTLAKSNLVLLSTKANKCFENLNYYALNWISIISPLNQGKYFVLIKKDLQVCSF